jgi:hypothetical protein
MQDEQNKHDAFLILSETRAKEGILQIASDLFVFLLGLD